MKKINLFIVIILSIFISGCSNYRNNIEWVKLEKQEKEITKIKHYISIESSEQLEEEKLIELALNQKNEVTTEFYSNKELVLSKTSNSLEEAKNIYYIGSIYKIEEQFAYKFQLYNNEFHYFNKDIEEEYNKKRYWTWMQSRYTDEYIKSNKYPINYSISNLDNNNNSSSFLYIINYFSFITMDSEGNPSRDIRRNTIIIPIE